MTPEQRKAMWAKNYKKFEWEKRLTCYMLDSNESVFDGVESANFTEREKDIFTKFYHDVLKMNQKYVTKSEK